MVSSPAAAVCGSIPTISHSMLLIVAHPSGTKSNATTSFGTSSSSFFAAILPTELNRSPQWAPSMDSRSPLRTIWGNSIFYTLPTAGVSVIAVVDRQPLRPPPNRLKQSPPGRRIEPASSAMGISGPTWVSTPLRVVASSLTSQWATPLRHHIAPDPPTALPFLPPMTRWAPPTPRNTERTQSFTGTANSLESTLMTRSNSSHLPWTPLDALEHVRLHSWGAYWPTHPARYNALASLAWARQLVRDAPHL